MDPAPTTSLEGNIVKALWKISKNVLDTLDFKEVTQKTCDSLLNELGYLKLGYRIIVLSLYSEELKGLQRVSLSQTPEAQAAVSASPIPFHDILIPIDATENFCVKAFTEQKPQITTDWKDLLSPPLSPEDARHNQSAAEIKTSMVFPIIVRGKSVGTIIFSLVKEYSEVQPSEFDLINGFTEIIGIAVQNARLYTQLEKTTHDLDEANKHLTELDKMKDEFLSLASHELRTPMTAIKGYVWMVQNGKAGVITDTTRNYLDIVYKSTERLIHLVNDMLDISRIESGKVQLHPEPVNIPDIINQVKNEFSAQARDKQMSLSASVIDSLPQISADKDKITQVLENLVGNAMKYTPEGGKITLSAIPKDSTVEISVTDTGKGISAEDLPKLFTKFTRLGGESLTTFSQPGTGLGLYLAKQYIELHHGKIWAASTLGSGSTFTFSLPVSNITA